MATLSGIRAIAANGNFSLALGQDGRVWAWGQNASGQVGKGTAPTSAEPTPREVNSLPTIRAIAAGHSHALALDADGKVWSWGKNDFGQVGTGSATPSVLVPTLVTNLPRVKAIAAGSGHSLVIDEQFGNVWAWGQNSSGQAGSGTPGSMPVLTPTPVNGLFAATQVSAGHSFSMVIMGSGFVKTWGLNASGQLGHGVAGGNSVVPVDVVGMTDATAIAAGYHHALAVRPDCPVWTWGNNGQGQLGTGATTTAATTAPMASLILNTFYFDGDMDGFGDEYIALESCTAPDGYVEDVDCDDFTSTTFPGAPEQCNGMDDSCDGVADDGDPGGGSTCATGLLGVCATGTTACTGGSVVCAQNQSASNEQCDNLDNDCDGAVDDGNPGGLQDCATGDQGVCGEGVTYCTHGVIDCVQKQGPSAEVCDARDNDCNGQSDDGLATQTWHPDADGDGHGNGTVSTQACTRPSGYVANTSDCNDGDAGIYLGALETCDGVDNNCNGSVDEGEMLTWYRDADGDGYGSASLSTQACTPPSGYVANTSDCHDNNASIRPNASEVCDGMDNNCNGTVDEGVMKTWYLDADGDGYGKTNYDTAQSCVQPAGYAANFADCNDTIGAVNPGTAEQCGDFVDNNCSGLIDEDCSE